MQLIIESSHIKVGANLEAMIREKIQHLERLHHRITRCVVLLKKEKHDRNKTCLIETRISAPRKTLFASEQAENFEAALMRITDNLTARLRRHKKEREEIW